MSAARKPIVSNADFLPKANWSPASYKTFPLITNVEHRDWLEKASYSHGPKAMLGDPDRWLGTPVVFNPLQAAINEFAHNVSLLNRLGNDKMRTIHAQHEDAQKLASRTNGMILPLRDACRKHADRLLDEAESEISEALSLDGVRYAHERRAFDLLDKWTADPEGAMKIREAANEDKVFASIISVYPRTITGVTEEQRTNLRSEAIDRFAPEAAKKIEDGAALRNMSAGHDQVMRSVSASFGNATMAAFGAASRVDID